MKILSAISRTNIAAGLLILSPFFAAPSYAQAPAIEGLPAVSDLLIPEVSAPEQAETYPDYEQDRKPGWQVQNSGGVRVLGGVRFERDAKADVYRWGEMRIEDADLDEAYFGYRSGGTGHNILMFSFTDGTRLVVEALPWKKKGEEFKPFSGGISGKYPLVWNMVEWNSFLETAVGSQGLYVDVYPLDLSREDKLRLLDEAIAEAVKDHSADKYHTFFNSCSTSALKVFTKATGHHLLVGRMLPTVVIKHMKLRGFLGARQRSDASNWPRPQGR